MTHDTTPYIWGCVIVSVDTVHVVRSDWILAYSHCWGSFLESCCESSLYLLSLSLKIIPSLRAFAM